MRKLTLLLLVAVAIAFADAPSLIAIRGVKIVTGNGTTIASGTVVIRDGLIQDVGASVQAPPGAWIVEGAGLTVYPGLIDGLSRWGMPEPPAPTSGRGATALGMNSAAATAALLAPPPARGPEDRPSTTSWISAADQLNLADRHIDAFRSAGFTTAVAFPTRGIFAGQGSVLDLAGEKVGQMVVVENAGQYVSLRSDGGFASFPGSLMGVIAYIRQIYIDADHYQQVKAEYAKNPRGMTRPAYDRALEGVIASPRILLPATRAVEIERMARFAAELKQPTVLYGAHEAYRIAGEIKLPVLVSLKWPERSRDADPDEVESLRILELREQAPSTPAALTKAGVKWAFYSDGIDRPADLMKAVRKAIDAGLTQEQALRALTLSPAEIFGVADRLGSIEKGKIANLVVTKGDLFQDKTQVQYIFVDGQKFEPTPEEPTPGAIFGGGNRTPTGELQ
jgi:imidazolonepropionase-like amidohydrolase